jgi:hypothetical protein
MDESRFDTLARAIAQSGTRRRLVRLLLTLLLGGVLAVADEVGQVVAERPLNRVQRRTPQRTRKQHNPNQHNDNQNTKNKKKDKDKDEQGLLRNFALTVVNHSAKDWWFGVGSQGFFTADIEQRTVLHTATRRLLIEDDEADFFVPDGTVDEGGDPMGRLLHFSNPNVGLVKTWTYRQVHYFLKSKSVQADFSDTESDLEWSEGESHTINFGFVSFLVTRTKDSDRYKEFTLTFT